MTGLMRVSETYPVPTLTLGLPQDWEPTSSLVEDWGTLRLEFGGTHIDGTTPATGTDVTSIRGIRTRIGQLTFGEPFGEGIGAVTFPGITPFDELDTAFPWSKKGTTVDVWHVLPGGATEYPYWCGRVASREDATDLGLTLHLGGALTLEAAARMHQPQMLNDERDIGTALAQDLTPLAYSRPIPGFGFSFTTATTGITTRKRGSRSQSVLDFAGELLSLAQDNTGQWTISRAYSNTDHYQSRKYYLRRKGTLEGPIQLSSVSVGGRGVGFQLADDVMESPNAIYGEGVDPTDQSRWRNAKYPNLNPRPVPTFPGDLAYLDEDPMYGKDWITRVQAVMRADGWPDVQVTGTYDDDTTNAVYAVQQNAGITGTTNPQLIDSDTWDAIWDVAGTTTVLSSGYFRPLAWDQAVEPWTYYADGSIKGENDLYDPLILRVEQTLSYGEECRKGAAQANAGRLVARETQFGPYSGSITLDGVSPEERCAFDIREGSLLRLRYYRGSGAPGVLFFVSGVAVNPESRTVTLTVDQKPYDLLALAEKIARNKESRQDPARSLISLRNRTSKPFKDATGWDKESGAGHVPPTVLESGWNVLKVIATQQGSLAAIKAITTDDPSKFAMALFAKEITPAEVAALVTDPLAEDTSKYGWWNKPAKQDDLKTAGYLEAWGEFKEACGYWPGRESDDHDITGKMIDAASLSIASLEPPFIWLAVYVAAACTFRAEMRITIAD